MKIIGQHLLCLGSLVASLHLIVACTQNKAPGANAGLLQSASVQEAAGPWCMIDNMSGSYQIVTRMTFYQQSFRFDYLRLSPNTDPVLYHENSGDWVPHSDSNSPIHFGKVVVELVDDAKRVPFLSDFNQQRLVTERILANNLRLRGVPRKFEPSRAILVKNQSLLRVEPTVREMYPCAQYSTSFLMTSPVSPIVEHDVFLAQSLWLATSQKVLPTRMSFTFPIEEIQLESVPTNTQWCSWFETGRGQQELNQEDIHIVLTMLIIGTDQAITLDQTGAYGDPSVADSQMTDLLKSDAKQAAIRFSVRTDDGRLRMTESDEANGRPIRFSKIYSLIQDARGTKALVRRSSSAPHRASLPAFSEIYFDCADPRPLNMNRNLKRLFPAMLEVLKEQLGQRT